MELILLFGLALSAVLAWTFFCRFDHTGGRLAGWINHPRVRQARSWFCKRFRRGERFGFSLTIGLLVSLLAGWMFGELADEIFEAELLTQLDLAFGEGLLGLVSETTSQLFFWITQFANPLAIAAGVFLASLWLANRHRIVDILMLLIAVGGGAAINLIVKLLFSRPRPNFLEMFYEEIGFSFPSGHAMLSVLFYGMLAYLIGRSLDHWGPRIAVMIVAALIALIVGFSRLVLGVHFLSDVLGGWAAGIVWLSACITAREVGGSSPEQV